MVVLNLNKPADGLPSRCAVVPTGISALPVVPVSDTTPVIDAPLPLKVVAVQVPATVAFPEPSKVIQSVPSVNSTNPVLT